MIRLVLNSSGVSLKVSHVETFVQIGPRCHTFLVCLGWGETPSCSCSQYKRSGRRHQCRHIQFVRDCQVLTPSTKGGTDGRSPGI